MRVVLTPAFRDNPAVYPKLCWSSVLGIEEGKTFHIGPRVINDWIVMYVTKGRLTVRQHDQTFCLGEDEYIFVDLHDRHEYFFDPAIPSEIFWMHMNGDLVRMMAGCIARVSPLPVTGRDPAVLAAVKKSHMLNSPVSVDPWEHAMNLIAVLSRLLDNAHRQSRSARRPDEAEIFRSEVEAALSRCPLSSLTLDTLCAEMHISKYYFSHRFKEVYGVTPMKYVLGRKLARAKILLQNTDLKVHVISAECGFANSGNFSTVFRREVGMTPAEYRARKTAAPPAGE